jgi:hypothetical protein
MGWIFLYIFYLWFVIVQFLHRLQFWFNLKCKFSNNWFAIPEPIIGNVFDCTGLIYRPSISTSKYNKNSSQFTIIYHLNYLKKSIIKLATHTQKNYEISPVRSPLLTNNHWSLFNFKNFQKEKNQKMFHFILMTI